jgi:hypothetical protein
VGADGPVEWGAAGFEVGEEGDGAGEGGEERGGDGGEARVFEGGGEGIGLEAGGEGKRVEGANAAAEGFVGLGLRVGAGVVVAGMSVPGYEEGV